MTPFRVSRRLKTAIKARLAVTLIPSGATGELSPEEHEAIFALFQVITDDQEFPFDEYRRFVDRRTREVPSLLGAYRQSVALLDRFAARAAGGRSFARLGFQERDAVLLRLFRRTPHPERQSARGRSLRLAARTLCLLFASDARRALRHQVMRELLCFYYATARGWAALGWSEFPGKAR